MANKKGNVTEASKRLLRTSINEVAIFNRARMDAPPSKADVRYVVRAPNGTTRCDGCAHYESEDDAGAKASHCALLNDTVAAGGHCDWQLPGRVSKPDSNDPNDVLPPHGIGGATRGGA